MSIYRCEECEITKDNDKECTYLVDKEPKTDDKLILICQSCWDKRVEDLDETKRDSN